ncbi:MAG: adenosine deaminase [Bdellovibrionales bacterium]|nr:adenosine deaminase [Bdellovibrionales bacterium]
MKQLTRDDIIKIPKAELHRHLELTYRVSTLQEIAKTLKFDLPWDDNQKFADSVVIRTPMKDLETVLKKFLSVQRLLSSEEILERLAFEAVEDAYNEGLRILEYRYAPTFLEEGHSHMDFEKIHRALMKGLRRGEATYPIAVGMIGIIQRIKPIADAERVTRFVLDHKEDFVGLDLADSEQGFDSRPFAKYFDQAKSAGLGITIHSGEVPHPKAPSWVSSAIQILGAQRIGHGLMIIHDQKVMDEVIEKKVTLELCPTSNWLTNAVPDTRSHPFRKLQEKGVPVTLNSDDPGIFGIDLSHEYMVLHRDLGYSLEELTKLGEAAARASFIPISKRRKVWPGL